MKQNIRKIVIASGINNEHLYLSVMGNEITHVKEDANGVKLLLIANIVTKSLKIELQKKDGVQRGIPLLNQIKNSVIDVSLEGDRWEGDSWNGNPCGWGRYYDCRNLCVYEGFMYQDEFVCFGSLYYEGTSIIQYSGMFYCGTKTGYGKLFDVEGNLLSTGCWMKNQYLSTSLKTYQSCEDRELIHSLLRVIVIGNNSFNQASLSTLQFMNYPYLNKLIIGNNCCRNVSTCVVSRMKCLRSLTIGSYSFFNLKGTHCSFTCRSCPSLLRMNIDYKAFCFYNVFTIKCMEFSSFNSSFKEIEINHYEGR